MRKIKYRAWNKEKNIMVYDNEDNSAYYWDGVCDSDIGMLNTILTSEFTLNTYDFMQYTELKDRNGIEIYEGDILECKLSSGKLENYKIIFNQDECCFECINKDNTNFICSNIWKECRIIGNIYENLNLLNL